MSKTPSQSTATTTQSSAPWSGQQPYLSDVFAQAQNLYNSSLAGNGPQYYPTSTVQPFTPEQNQAIQQTTDIGLGTDPLQLAASNFQNTLLSGHYLTHNPYEAQLQALGSTNYGTTANPGEATLQSMAGTNPGGSSNAAYAPLNTLPNTNYGTGNLGTNTLVNQSGTNLGGAVNPGTSGLSYFATGQNVAQANPATDPTAAAVMAQVVPQIESQFINGGMLSSPEAAYATSQGVAAALAPLEYQNYQAQLTNQLAGASQLGSQYLQGAGLQQQAAGTLGSQAISGGQAQAQAAANLGNQLLTGAGQQQQAASTLGSQAIQGAQAQQQAASSLGSIYNTGLGTMETAMANTPSLIQSQYVGPQQAFAAQQLLQQQQQAELNDLVNRYNYYQTLPYQMLQQYAGLTSGNYGGTSVTQSPYFTNPTTNLLGTIGSVASAVPAVISAVSSL